MISRRSFVAGLATLSGAAAANPFDAHAQTPPPVIGWLNSQSPTSYQREAGAFVKGLAETSFVEGRNVTLEYRWAERNFDRVPSLAAELVRMRVAVIVAGGGDRPALEAKALTTTIPIVSTFGGDPAAQGLVSSLNRPGGNLTGVSLFTHDLMAKRLELIHEILPNPVTIGFLADSGSPHVERVVNAMEAAAQRLGVQLRVLGVKDVSETEAAFATFRELRVDGLVIFIGALLIGHSSHHAVLAARHRIPTISSGHPFVAAGGLVGYGTDVANVYRQLGVYAGMILKGASPADLPVQFPTKFELVVNLRTAKALGITIPRSVLLRADEVIE
jgi:putative ABC transport system substrate-binding protein